MPERRLPRATRPAPAAATRPAPAPATGPAPAGPRLAAWFVAATLLISGCGNVALPALAPSGGRTAPAGGAKTAKTATTAVPSLDGLPKVQYSPASPPPAWPGPLPYPIVIADRGNRRLLEVTPTKQIVWRFPATGGKGIGSPDDAFFTPSGNSMITNEEHQGTINVLNYYTRRVTWTYGHRGVLRYGNGYLNYPDDAYRLPNGDTVVADIRNCRELIISPQKKILQQWGAEQDGGRGACPNTLLPRYLGSPNGDTPQPNGDILLSLINGNWVSLMSPHGRPIWSAKVPDIGHGYVSDAQLLPDGNVLTADYGKPGKVIVFNPHTGKVVWLYDVRSGPGELNHPSLAEQLPNGNVILNDDYNDRVVVIGWKTRKIVWQYGKTGVTGTAPGYLNTPDGFAVDYYRNWRAWTAAGSNSASKPAG